MAMVQLFIKAMFEEQPTFKPGLLKKYRSASPQPLSLGKLPPPQSLREALKQKKRINYGFLP